MSFSSEESAARSDAAAAVERQFQELLTTQGLHPALGFLNARTTHRFTGVYRFDGDVLRNIALFDRWEPALQKGADAPMSETFCAITGKQGSALQVMDGRTDGRFPWMADNAVVSYCGAVMPDMNGAPFGTLCHFDLNRCQVQSREIPLLEVCAQRVRNFLAEGA